MKFRFVVSLIAMGLCVALLGITGCSDSDGDGDGSTTGGLPGTWTIAGATVTAPLVGENALLLQAVGVSVSGNTMTVDSAFLSLFGISATLIIDDDGTWALQVTVPTIPHVVAAGTYTAEGTYTLAGDRVTLTVTTAPAEAADLVSAGDTFTISYSQSGNSLNLSATSEDLGVAGTSGSGDFTR